MTTARSSPIGIGEAAPWFRCAGAERRRPAYTFDTAGGRAMLMLFFGTAADPAWRRPRSPRCRRGATLFDDEDAAFFGITVDPADAATGRIRQQLPGIRFFLDYDRARQPRLRRRARAAATPIGRTGCCSTGRCGCAGLFRSIEGEAALDALAALAARRRCRTGRRW